MNDGLEEKLFGLTPKNTEKSRFLWESSGEEKRTDGEKRRREALRAQQVEVAKSVKRVLLGFLPERERVSRKKIMSEWEERLGEKEAEMQDELLRNQYEILISVASSGKGEKPKDIMVLLCLDSGARHISRRTAEAILLRFGCRGDLLEAIRHVMEELKAFAGRSNRRACATPEEWGFFEDLDSMEKMVAYLCEIKNIA